MRVIGLGMSSYVEHKSVINYAHIIAVKHGFRLAFEINVSLIKRWNYCRTLLETFTDDNIFSPGTFRTKQTMRVSD